MEIPRSSGQSLAESMKGLLARTPARILQGRVGTAYRTQTQLTLRLDHAFARDAVHAELTLNDLGSQDLIQRLGLFEVQTQASNKSEYLMRPDLGRSFSSNSRDEILKQCPTQANLQIVIGDGLSATAVICQVPRLLPELEKSARGRGWTTGKPFLIRHCRVGILNEIGELLNPEVVVLLIGERPGLATSESLSAYMAYRPRSGHTDAERNLISNIHDRGVSHPEAVGRILGLADQMQAMGCSGVRIKEEIIKPGEPEIPRIGS